MKLTKNKLKRLIKETVNDFLREEEEFEMEAEVPERSDKLSPHNQFGLPRGEPAPDWIREGIKKFVIEETQLRKKDPGAEDPMGEDKEGLWNLVKDFVEAITDRNWRINDIVDSIYSDWRNHEYKQYDATTGEPKSRSKWTTTGEPEPEETEAERANRYL